MVQWYPDRHFVRTLTGSEAFPALRLIYLAGEPVYKPDVAYVVPAVSPVPTASALSHALRAQLPAYIDRLPLCSWTPCPSPHSVTRLLAEIEALAEDDVPRRLADEAP
jgi:hypothetical protein